MKRIRLNQGFTLIELLVVITLIAILAVAVLATINPVEQRRKATDTSTVSLLGEYIAAQERYFASYGCYTNLSNSGGSCALGACKTFATGNFTIGAGNNTAGCTTLLGPTGSQEVKQNILDRLSQSTFPSVTVTIDANEQIHASFAPVSNTFKSKGAFNASCTGTGALYCVPDTIE